jgi:phenylalanyl-tRNA synthetase alpha subunit
LDAETTKALIAAGQAVIAGLAAAWVKRGVAEAREKTKKHQDLLAENERLRTEKMETAIKSAVAQVRADITSEFKGLKAEVQGALKVQKEASDSNLVKYAKTVAAMKQIIEQSETRFVRFQSELKDLRVLVERIRKPGG